MHNINHIGFFHNIYITVYRKNFNDVKQYCQEIYGTHLIIINSNETFQNLLFAISQSNGPLKSFMIGLNNTGNGYNVNQYQWTDRSFLDYCIDISDIVKLFKS